jgi:hypothetical protein
MIPKAPLLKTAAADWNLSHVRPANLAPSAIKLKTSLANF